MDWDLLLFPQMMTMMTMCLLFSSPLIFLGGGAELSQLPQHRSAICGHEAKATHDRETDRSYLVPNTTKYLISHGSST